MNRRRYPLVRVVTATLRSGGFILMEGKGGFLKKRWWYFTLACGHDMERGCSYGGKYGRGWQIIQRWPPRGTELPPPKRVRCDLCPKESRP